MKIDRLIGIIMYLNNRSRVTANELAERYEVSIKTIHRDMEAINQAGIPVVSYRGQDGGYEILKEYQIDRSVLTQTEISWILQILSALDKNFPFQEFAAMKEKFGAIDKEKQATSKIFIDFSTYGSESKTAEKLKFIEEAFMVSRILVFQYRNLRGECLVRRVEPLQLIFKGVRWYLLAWCTDKQDYRLFRVKRMRDLQLGKFFYEKRETNWDELFSSWNRSTETIRFKFAESFREKLDDYFDTYQVDGNIAIVSWPVDEWVSGFFIGLGAEVEVLEPIYLREKIRGKAKKLYEVYQ